MKKFGEPNFASLDLNLALNDVLNRCKSENYKNEET